MPTIAMATSIHCNPHPLYRAYTYVAEGEAVDEVEVEKSFEVLHCDVTDQLGRGSSKQKRTM